MLKKRTEDQKRQDREKMEKCIFGMHLAKEQKKWVEENAESNEKFAKYLITSTKTKNRAIAGSVTADNMQAFADVLGCDVKAMKAVNAHSILELIVFRLAEVEHRRSILLAMAMIVFAIVSVFTNSIGAALLMIIFGNLFLHNARNLWNIKLDATQNPDGTPSRLMRTWDIIAAFSIMALVILICKI